MFPKSLIKRITWLLLTFSLVVALAPAPAAHGASSILVSATGTTSWPCGGTWASACALQTAFAHAASDAEIWVGKGVYKPTTSTTDRTATFQLVSGVAVYGGFALTETLRTQRNPAANVVVLSGDIDNNDVVNAQGVVATAANIRGNNSYHVVWGANGATLDGVTITAGNADGSGGTDGGGMFNFAASSLTLINITFSGNAAADDGGGMFNVSSSPTLSNVTFSGNAAADDGGGMYNGGGSNPTLINVTFSGNTANYRGGGMANIENTPTLTNVTFSGNAAASGGGMYNNWYSSPTLINVTFSSNAAIYDGGGMYNYVSSPTLINVTFSGNVATAYNGGGMYNFVDSSPTLTNVTFSGNAAASGGGMYNNSNSSPQVRNTLLWGDSGSEIYNASNSMPTISDSVVQGGCPSGSTCTNVISADPRLASFGNYGGSTRTFALLPGSAAINATSANCPLTDQRGVARDSTCDIGAFESQGFTLGSLTGTPQSTIRNTAFAQPLGLSVTSAFSEPIAGGVISFIAPVSGASLAQVTPFIKTISASGAVSATVTANGLTGSYTVTASAGGGTSANFALTNLGQTLYARSDGATSGACATWADACTLQYALTQATARDEIWVGKGVYKPTTSTTDRTATFQLVSGVAVYGGFALTETLHTQRDPAANVVVLSGDIDNNDMVDAQGVVTTSVNLTGTNSYHVVWGANGATLDGVTITAGNTQGGYPNVYGGGMYNSSSSPTLINVTFSGNAATFGGGMCNGGGSSPTLISVTFSGNAATYSGGGMYNESSSPTLSNVTFSGNMATDINGGGMYNVSSSPTLSNVTFNSNSAPNGYGGGMFNYQSSPTLTNVTFSGNTAAQYGGGMYNGGSSSPTLTNVTFSGNVAPNGRGGGMVNWDNSNPQVRNTLLWGDSGGEIYNANSTSTVSNSVVQGGCPSESTCINVISADPRLAPLGNYSGRTPTHALLPGSAAIAATNANCPATDQRGVTRGSTCDIGAFESQGFTLGTLTGTPQSASINTAFAQPLGLSVTSAFSEPVAGGVISFTAPASGASLAETTPFTKTIGASGAVSATVTANGLTGSYTVTASASGATSVNFALTNKLATTTTLTSAPNPSVLGQAVTFTATVTSSGGTPTGSITFTIDSTNLTVPLGANGQAVYVTQTLSLGNHPTSATYSGDANFNVSSGVLSGGQTVNDVAVTGLISINSSPTRLTDITYFTATVATGSNLTYQWNFGDGQTASGALSSHTYTTAGNYAAIVTATNGAGSVSTATPVTITNQRPVANAGAAQSVLVNAVVTLAGSGSTDPDGHLPLTYRWAQSGGPSVTFTPNVSATSFTAPSAPAVLTFTLHVTDAQGLPNLTGESIVITVGDVAIANLTAANDSPLKVGHLTHFTATLSAGSNVIYTWDFGNGQMSSGAFSSHTYAVAGNYTATVTATNNLGSVSASTLVTIEPVRLYLPLVLK